MRRFVVGDIHGGYKALLQVLERAGFDREKDMLISLGDVVDGWPEVKECIQFLIDLPHKIMLLGNHDYWFIRWVKYGEDPDLWLYQGGLATFQSYGGKRGTVPPQHLHFLESSPRIVELGDQLFVHGGIDPQVEDWRMQLEDVCLWDRDMVTAAYKYYRTSPIAKEPELKFGKWKDIFVGHTTTTNFQSLIPLRMANVWALDTGGGWEGKLSVMDIDTYEFWQSEPVSTFYPNHGGRLLGRKVRKQLAEEARRMARPENL